MEAPKVERLLVRAGFLLFTLALLTGLAVPAFLNHRMAVAAHLTGVVNALLLIAVGLAWGLLAMSPVQARLTWGRLPLLRLCQLGNFLPCRGVGDKPANPAFGCQLQRRGMEGKRGAGPAGFARADDSCRCAVGGLCASLTAGVRVKPRTP